MDPKDFKFNDDAFDDVFKVSDAYSENSEPSRPRRAVQRDEGKPYTAKKAASEKTSFESEFDEIFSAQNYHLDDEDRAYIDEVYAENEEDGQFMNVHTTRPTPSNKPENNPYSYNYNNGSRPRRVRDDYDEYEDEDSYSRDYDYDDDIDSGRQPRGHRGRSFSAGKLCAILLILILALVLVGGVGGYFYAKELTKKVNYQPLSSNQYASASSLRSENGVKNILLVGVDGGSQREGEIARSDTMMLLTIDDNHNQLKLSSFLRDTYIDIPGYKEDKLNAAQSHGGTQLLVDTLEYNFGIDIDNYMLVNFDMFITIVDSMGGVDVEVTEAEADYINSKDHMTEVEAAAFPNEIIADDSVHLTGAQALWYARIRYLDSDFMRTQRQRKVISAIVHKATRTDPVTLMGMLDKIVPMIETDLTSDEMMSLGMNSVKYIRYDIAQQQIPADNTWSNARRKGSGAVLEIDLEKNKQILQDFVFNEAQTDND